MSADNLMKNYEGKSINNKLTITPQIEEMFFDFINEIGLTETRVETIKALWNISKGKITFETRLIIIAKALHPNLSQKALKGRKRLASDRIFQIKKFQQKNKFEIIKVTEEGEPCRTNDGKLIDYTPKRFEFVILTRLVNENMAHPENNTHTNFKNLLRNLHEELRSNKEAKC